MRAARLALAAVAAAGTLAACNGGDAHKGEHCARSHVAPVYDPPIYVRIGGGPNGVGGIMVPVGGGWHEQTFCDEWAPNNPSTVRPADVRGN